MFRLSCDEIQRRHASKLIQKVEELLKWLDFDDLAEPEAKVEVSATFQEVIKRYERIVNPKGDGEQLYAFDAPRLL